jgi:hypothetical protein
LYNSLEEAVMKGPKNFTVKKALESYSCYFLDYNGDESDRPYRMTARQASYLAKYWGGFVVEMDEGSWEIWESNKYEKQTNHI